MWQILQEPKHLLNYMLLQFGPKLYITFPHVPVHLLNYSVMTLYSMFCMTVVCTHLVNFVELSPKKHTYFDVSVF